MTDPTACAQCPRRVGMDMQGRLCECSHIATRRFYGIHTSDAARQPPPAPAPRSRRSWLATPEARGRAIGAGLALGGVLLFIFFH